MATYSLVVMWRLVLGVAKDDNAKWAFSETFAGPAESFRLARLES